MLRNDYVGTGYIDGAANRSAAGCITLIRNKPYDQLTRELISPNAESEVHHGHQMLATSASQVVDHFANVTQVFLGVNECASCHDSFIDHWKLDDAYSIAAVIATSRSISIVATRRPAFVAALWPELGAIDAKATKAALGAIRQARDESDNGRFTHHRQSFGSADGPASFTRRYDGEQTVVGGSA